ncbi:LapA family protein [Jatrophihabitans fulvus]
MTAPQQPTAAPSSTPATTKRNVSVGQVLAGILLVLIVVFVVENTRTVPIRFIAGPEVKVPVYLAILIAAVVGALVASLMRFRRQHKK